MASLVLGPSTLSVCLPASLLLGKSYGKRAKGSTKLCCISCHGWEPLMAWVCSLLNIVWVLISGYKAHRTFLRGCKNVVHIVEIPVWSELQAVPTSELEKWTGSEVHGCIPSSRRVLMQPSACFTNNAHQNLGVCFSVFACLIRPLKNTCGGLLPWKPIG